MQKASIVLLVLCLSLAVFISAKIEAAQRLKNEVAEAFQQRDKALAQLAIAINALQESNKAKGIK